MAGSSKGGKLATETIRAKYGNDWYAKIGAKGGSVKNPKKGFGTRDDLVKLHAGRGGRKSKRTKREI